MDDITADLVGAFTGLAPLDVLRASPSVLLGVSPAAAAQLTALDIHSVFDLASSRVFANAAMLLDAATDPRSMLARYGLAPSDVVELLPAGLDLSELPQASVRHLEGIGAGGAAGVETALLVESIRDLAVWPPYRAAQRILAAVLTPAVAPGADPQAPVDLLPKNGEFPTERVSYDSLVFDGYEREPDQLTPLEQAGPIAVDPAAGDTIGFKEPGVGALLTFSQSWYSLGVTLGQLLHSVALAPGETTRIAMIDWSRRTKGAQSESSSETEQLANETMHARALSEVTAAVASEAQSGFSTTEMSSASSEAGSASGFSLGPITLGGSSGGAATSSKARSFSSSSGRRDLQGSLTQSVMDRTQQHASSARGRRASVVREVSQTESESVSTRAVTNYNHMHAMSVQYYEIVQVYRVAVALERAEKCLFIPMALVDFRKADVVKRFRGALAAAAIDARSRTLLTTDFEIVTITSPTGAMLTPRNVGSSAVEVSVDKLRVSMDDETVLTSFTIFRSRGGINDLPTPSKIEVLLRDGTSAGFTKKTTTPPADTITLDAKTPLREIASIRITGAAVAPANDPLIAFQLQQGATVLAVEASFVLAAGVPTDVLTFTGGGVLQRLIDHLQENRMHYSQAVWMSLDPATVLLLLAGFSYRGLPLAGRIDPQPVTVAGNYLVFRRHINPDPEQGTEEEKEWSAWLQAHGVTFGPARDDLVPLPSGGVFAEAVLGRYNSAEKLDITRFWNWQDSPIPIVAPEIQAIQTGSRAQPEADLKASPFSQPLVNIVSPTSLPEPTSLGTALQSIANGSMFRDMSGLAQTIGLAQAGAEGTLTAASEAAGQAGSNMAIAAKKEVEQMKAALAFVAAMYGRGGTDTSPSTISNEGAKINHGRSMDTRGLARPETGGAAGAADAGAGVTGGSVGGVPTAGAGGPENPAPSTPGAAPAPGYEQGAFERSIGETPSEAVRQILAAPGHDIAIGVDAAADAGTKAPGTLELNVTGEFAWTPPLTAAEEKAIMSAGSATKWGPATADFGAAIGANSTIVSSLGGLLYAIWSKPAGSIKRVNIFTHANHDLISFSGTLTRVAGGEPQVLMATNGPADNLTTLDAQAMTALSAGATLLPPAGQPGGPFTATDVRTRFGAGAVIVVYACHAGQSKAFLKRIATFFGVDVIGFTSSVLFHPPAQPATGAVRRAGMEVGLVGVTPSTDWRALAAAPQAVRVNP